METAIFAIIADAKYDIEYFEGLVCWLLNQK